MYFISDSYSSDYKRGGLGRVLTGPAARLKGSVKKKLRSAAVARRAKAVTGMSQGEIRSATRMKGGVGDLNRKLIRSQAKKGANRMAVEQRVQQLGYGGRQGIKNDVWLGRATGREARINRQKAIKNVALGIFGRNRR